MTKEIALTFDDGPWGATTPRVLDILIKRKIPATFMIWGEHAKKYPEVLKRVATSGLFALGNHTYTHPQLNDLSESEIRQELLETDKIVQELTGLSLDFVRPPFGDCDSELLAMINRPVICWSLDTMSWKHGDAAKCVEQIYLAKDGDILLMHDMQEADAKALPQILDYLEEEKFIFKTIPGLLKKQGLDEPYIYYSRDRRNKSGF
ncbi:polysaccharide deacetylase family protein [Lactococcus kimchii]|uniref:polysaccharide deacetylase family protein n=1 Tax=Lactococcus sp. S-13 TaxID=2507158 RepID=UPI001022F1C5|nr:polysaccharide deacetylase family protein [Lactococcus sp. S-13]RZI48085.1 polysaccharide deacetylase family protein [Lactococcus sp. S-13]